MKNLKDYLLYIPAALFFVCISTAPSGVLASGLTIVKNSQAGSGNFISGKGKTTDLQKNKNITSVISTASKSSNSISGQASQNVDPVSDTSSSNSPSEAIVNSGLLAKNPNVENYERNIHHIFPMIINSEIVYYIHYYQTAGRKFFKYALSRSERYIPMIKGIFKKLGLPNDLAYLAMVESGFSPTAYSYAGASGMWQFIPSTGRLFGLTVNWWVDERRNPVESTYAAGEYLKELFNKFGSWYLAAAAYNSGEITIERALSLYPGGDFWTISQNRPYLLPMQTRKYVPKIIAAAIIAKDPENFGFKNIKYENPVSIKQVKIPFSVSLYALAKCIGISKYRLWKLNPELLRDATPPYDPDFELNIPADKYSLFLKNFKHIRGYIKEEPKVAYASYRRYQGNFYYSVRPGDTLSGIASRYGISARRLGIYNGLRSFSFLRIGEKLIIPGKPSYHHYTNSYTEYVRYSVRPGDTLSGIASRYGISARRLGIYNGLRSFSFLRIGEKLIIPTSRRNINTENISPSFIPNYITVRPGMTLWGISRKYDVSLNKIKAINHINGNNLHLGEKIFIQNNNMENIKYSYASYTPNKEKVSAGRGPFIYRVEFGDSLYSIASKFHDNIKNIMAYNHIKNPNSIYPGEVIKINQ